jgi:ubiquinone/menaquinone biosynthesis C-methylase UbiE
MRLEARGQNPRFQQMLQEYLDAMQIDGAESVLDIGCGTGVATRAILSCPGFGGKVTGIDLSDYLVSVAQGLVAESDSRDRAEFRVGDTRTLALPDNHYDAVVAHTLVSHVDLPLQAIKEMARVVKPGGKIAIFDGDYASLTFSHPDPVEGKRYDELIHKGIITQARVMRQMPRLLKQAGLQLEASFFYVLAEVGKAEFWVSGIESFSRLLPISGVMTTEEANAWADARLKESAEGIFFGSSNYCTYVMSKPLV